MLKDILVATQDMHLHEMCRPLYSASNFHLFSTIDDALSKIAELQDGIVVFVDVEWPNEQNGYNVARELKKRRDDSKVFLLTDYVDDVALPWASKVKAEMIERTESAFLSRLGPLANTLGLSLTGSWPAHIITPKTPSPSPVIKIEAELEHILGPMAPLLLEDALAATNGNLKLALLKVAEFGTTTTERNQITGLISQLTTKKE
jgi:hypothetical protein